MTNLFNPFPGLRPFKDDEYKLFFGREEHVEEIIRKLNKFKFVSVVGNSGSGKSSLIKAGVFPKIALEKENKWIISSMKPGQNPLQNLCKSIINTKEFNIDPDQEGSIIDILKNSEKGLIQVVRKYLQSDKLLIFVDQFEEIFRYIDDNKKTEEYKDSAEYFVKILLESSAQRDIPIHVLMTIRSDFLGDCEQFENLPEAINDGQFLIPRMKSFQLARTIQSPMELGGGKIAPRLVQQLVGQIGSDKDRLPILQHFLNRVWEVWNKEGKELQPIDLEHFEKIGGLDNALSIHAEEAWSELKNAKQQGVAEKIFKTLTVKEADRGVRRPTSVKNLALIAGCSSQEIIEVVNIFRLKNRGFLLPPQNIKIYESSIIDISHESLMRVWGRLIDLVEEESKSANLYKRISNNAILYEKDEAGLWYNPDLQIALDWIVKLKPNGVWAAQYNDDFKQAIKFIELSEENQNFEQKEKERRRKLVVYGLTGFLIILSGLALWAVSERNQSVKNENLAIKRQKEAQEQRLEAINQTKLASKNLALAKNQEQKALEASKQAEFQRNNAMISAKEADKQRLRAEFSALQVKESLRLAEKERIEAIKQKNIADQNRAVAEKERNLSNKMRMLSIAQTLAIKSKLINTQNDSDAEIKGLLALKAYDFTLDHGGDLRSPDLYESALSALSVIDKKAIKSIRKHSDMIKYVFTFSSADNEEFILSYADDKKLNIHRIKDLTTVQSEYIDVPIKSIVLDAQNSKIYMVTYDNQIQVRALNDLKLLRSIKLPFKDAIDAEISGNNLFIASSTGYLLKYDIDNLEKYDKALTNNRIAGLEKGRNGKIFAMVNSNQIAELVLTPKLGFKIISDDLGNISTVKEIGNRNILVGSKQGTAKIIDISTGKLIQTLSDHKSYISDVAYDANKRKIYTSSYDGTIRVFDEENLNAQPIEIKTHKNWVTTIELNADRDRLISGSRDRSILVHPTNTESLIKRLLNSLDGVMLSREDWNKFIGSDIPMND